MTQLSMFHNYTWPEKRFFLPDVFTVEGFAYTSLPVDEVQINILVRSVNSSVSKCIEQNNKKVNSTIGQFQALNILDETEYSVEAISIRVIEIEDDESDSIQIQYEVMNILAITTPKLGQLGKILEVALNNGSNTIKDINFGVSCEKMKQKQEELIPQAIEDAKRQAMLTLSPLNLRIYSVKGVYPQYEQDDDQDYDPDNYFQPTRVYVTYSITIDFIVIPFSNKGFLREE